MPIATNRPPPNTLVPMYSTVPTPTPIPFDQTEPNVLQRYQVVSDSSLIQKSGGRTIFTRVTLGGFPGYKVEQRGGKVGDSTFFSFVYSDPLCIIERTSHEPIKEGGVTVGEKVKKRWVRDGI